MGHFSILGRNGRVGSDDPPVSFLQDDPPVSLFSVDPGVQEKNCITEQISTRPCRFKQPARVVQAYRPAWVDMIDPPVSTPDSIFLSAISGACFGGLMPYFPAHIMHGFWADSTPTFGT